MDGVDIWLVIGTCLSVLSQLFLCYGYLKLKEMRKHPEIMVVWQSLGQLMLDLHWLTGLNPLQKYVVPFCQVLGSVFMYFYILCFNSILFLSIEIFIKIKNPLISRYQNRIKVYRVATHVLCISVAVPLISVSNNNGKSAFGTCFVQQSSAYEFFVLIPVLIYAPVCLSLNAYSLRKANKDAKNRLKSHCYLAFVFLICWGSTAVLHGLQFFHLASNRVELKIVLVILLAPSGFYIFLARMSQKGLAAAMVSQMFRRKPKPGELKKDSGVSSINFPEGLVFLNTAFSKFTIDAVNDKVLALNKFFLLKISSKIGCSAKDEIQEIFQDINGKTVKMTQVYPKYFEEIMKISNISYSDLLKSFDLDLDLKHRDVQVRCQSLSGKSGAFFYFSYDQKFVIKSIKKKEFEVLCNFAEQYLEQIRNGKCLFVRIYAIFKMKVRQGYSKAFVIMENLLKDFESPLVFDLKGSKSDRRVSILSFMQFTDMPNDGVYKDLDFLNCRNESPFVGCEEVFKCLEKDSKLLRSFDIMDYSLLLVIEKSVEMRQGLCGNFHVFFTGKYWCSVALIDFLQTYSYKKKLETKLNSFKKNKLNTYSSIPPKQYRSRFLSFLKPIFAIPNNGFLLTQEAFPVIKPF